MIVILILLRSLLGSLFKSRAQITAENLLLRHQLNIAKRHGRERCADPSRHPAPGQRRICAHPRRPSSSSSSLLQNLIFGTHRDRSAPYFLGNGYGAAGSYLPAISVGDATEFG